MGKAMRCDARNSPLRAGLCRQQSQQRGWGLCQGNAERAVRVTSTPRRGQPCRPGRDQRYRLDVRPSALILDLIMAGPEQPPSVTFRYEKSETFGTFHADGILGGPQPSGNIYFAFYVERLANPRLTIHPFLDGGGIGPATTADADYGITRELQTAVVMNLQAVRGMVDLLHKFIKDTEAQQNADPAPNQ